MSKKINHKTDWIAYATGIATGVCLVFIVGGVINLVSRPIHRDPVIIENYEVKQLEDGALAIAFDIINVADNMGDGCMEDAIQKYLNYKKEHKVWNNSCDRLQEIITPHTKRG